MIPNYNFILVTQDNSYITEIEYEKIVNFDRSLNMLPRKISNIKISYDEAHIFTTEKYGHWDTIAEKVANYMGVKVIVIRISKSKSRL